MLQGLRLRPLWCVLSGAYWMEDRMPFLLQMPLGMEMRESHLADVLVASGFAH